MKRIAAIDTETGGFDPAVHGITEIAVVIAEVDLESLDHLITHKFTRLIRPTPELAYSPKALEIQGRTLEELKTHGAHEGRAYDDFEALMRDYDISDSQIIAHYAAFDYGFMHALKLRSCLHEGPKPRPHILMDTRPTWTCTRSLWQLLQHLGIKDATASSKLQHIAEHYGLEQPEPHTASMDAWVCLRVYIEMLKDMKEFFNA